MLLILDAYNILKAGAGSVDISESRRRHFVDVVSRYAALKKHQAHIVFDGGDYNRPTTSWHDGAQVTYAGHYQTADDIILKRLDEETPAEVILVSSDRELVDFAHQMGAMVVEAAGFFEHMKQELAPRPVRAGKIQSSGHALKREGHQSTPELDALMEAGTKKVFYKDDDRPFEDREQKGHKKSKVERQIERIVKKL